MISPTWRWRAAHICASTLSCGLLGRVRPEAWPYGLDRERLLREAPTIEEACDGGPGNGLRSVGRPVLLAAPAVWDGMFVHWYFLRFTGKSPFGATGSGVDLRSYWMGLTGVEWVGTRKGIIKHTVG